MIHLVYPDILDLFRKHLDPSKRSESASFLIWYLENYFRLDEIDAVDSVCDKRQDKGIDGIYYSEGEQTVYIFQSKLSQNSNSTIGDTLLKEFKGTLDQFKTQNDIEIILQGNGNELLKELINRINLKDIIDGCELKGVFIVNSELDGNGIEYLKHIDNIQFVGKNELEQSYVPVGRNTPKNKEVKFDLTGFQALEYILDKTTKCIITTISAKELARLDGIQNQSLFDLNVRGPLGKTKVNRDIEETLRKPEMHKAFPLYHNGITIICNFAELKDSTLTINKYYVVNGCQSLTVLYNNLSYLTDDLRVMVRIVKLDTSSDLAEKITKISNNQNGIKMRDFKSNHAVQVRLQNEMHTLFKGRYEYEVKRGEVFSGGIVIPNDIAGLQLVAFDLKEPWITHRKYIVFDEKYSEVFCRPEVNAFRIVMINEIYNRIGRKIDKIENRTFGQYALTIYMILYIVRRLLENDEVGKKLLTEPNIVFYGRKQEETFYKIMDLVLDDIMIDINEETKSLDVDFDYRGKLRDKEYVLKFSGEIVASYQKQITRKRVPSICEEWKKEITE